MVDRGKTETAKQHQVFLSYASEDKEIAQKIVNELREQNVHVWFDEYELQPGDSLAKALKKAISASDYLIVLLSPNSVNSGWMQTELGDTLASDLTNRDITLLPVVIADCEIPKFLASYQYIDLRPDLEPSITRLVEQIGIIPKIDFSELNWRSFEALSEELLSELGFEDIEQPLISADVGFDFKAKYSRFDPFGRKITETWLVQVKFYREARASLESTGQLAAYLLSFPEPSQGLLITDSYLTSAASEWLRAFTEKNRLGIRVVNGTELKRLLLQRKDLVEKYFVNNYTAAR